MGSFNQPQPGQRRLKLLSEDEIIAVRNAHPLTHGEVTENRLLEFPQVIVAHGGAAEDQPDGYLRRGTLSETCVSGSDPWEFPEETINVTGRSTVRVPYFAAVAPLLLFASTHRYGLSSSPSTSPRGGRKRIHCLAGAELTHRRSYKSKWLGTSVPITTKVYNGC